MLSKMRTFVKYYLGDYSDSISDVVLTHLARRLDETGYTYCCFWSFLLKNWEKNKLIHRNFIESPKVWEKFINARTSESARIQVEVAIDLKTFLVESRFYGEDTVIKDPNVSLMPIIRYAMGNCLGLPLMDYEQFRSQAIQQLREEPLLFGMLDKIKKGFPITEEEIKRNE